jgi:hypothetical protein
MSNCINIVKGEKVVFLRDEIDVDALKEFVTKAEENSLAWWFLQANSVIDSRGAVVMFGRGRSTHTNRDFDAVILALSKFMRKEKYHNFYVTEEGDGFRRVYHEVVEFKGYAQQLEKRDARIKAKIDAMHIDYSKIKVRTLTPNGWVDGDFATGLKRP